MIEFFEVMFRALTGLKLTLPTLVSLAAFFAVGYYFAAMTKRLGPLKVMLVLFVGYILASVLSGLLGVYTLAVALGFLSNQGLFLARVFMWAESLTELIVVLKHRVTFEDIRREEQSDPKHNQSQSRAQNDQKSQQSQGDKRQSNDQGNWSPKKGNPSDIAKARKILEIEVRETLTEKRIKKAYRRLAMIHHPDMPTGNHGAFVALGTAKDFLLGEV